MSTTSPAKLKAKTINEPSSCRLDSIIKPDNLSVAETSVKLP